MNIPVNNIGQLGELVIADYYEATGRYFVLFKANAAARSILMALRLEPKQLPALPGWLAIEYSRPVDRLLVDLVQIIGHLMFGREEMRQLTLTDDEAKGA